MKNEKNIILTIGIALGLISTLARLSIAGWLFLFGIVSTLIFGIIHLLFLYQLSNHFDNLKPSDKKLAWIGILAYPLIFLFQFDFGDSAGSFYVYEYLTGERTSDFEHFAFYIAVVSGIIYLINFIIWRVKIKNTVANNVYN
ncbi:hypothetical protein ACFS5M_09730 [Lacinutrix iliipiscaria]|uniref:Uncharacterized protein n=1 Tax=Lacinutrix iliipiscaria TaxID=1230532 RepID=A0ABW5WNZ3_9FLAO